MCQGQNINENNQHFAREIQEESCNSFLTLSPELRLILDVLGRNVMDVLKVNENQKIKQNVCAPQSDK